MSKYLLSETHLCHGTQAFSSYEAVARINCEDCNRFIRELRQRDDEDDDHRSNNYIERN